jgi:hypothetical protein
MKKAALIILVFSISSILHAQTAPENDCANMVKIAELAGTNQLNTQKVTPFVSKYFKTLFGDKLYASKLNLSGVLESFINEDPEDGASYNAFIKDYGTDAAAAQADFAVQNQKYEACFKTAEITHADASTTYMYFKKCKIELHTYKHGGTGTWVCKITMEYSGY